MKSFCKKANFTKYILNSLFLSLLLHNIQKEEPIYSKRKRILSHIETLEIDLIKRKRNFLEAIHISLLYQNIKGSTER